MTIREPGYLAPGRPFHLPHNGGSAREHAGRSPVQSRISRSLSSLLFVSFFSPVCPVAAAAAPVTGTVVDAAGRALPRVLVTLVDASGTTIDTTFSYPDGTFRRRQRRTCRLQGAGGARRVRARDRRLRHRHDLKLKLAVAPIPEAVVVSATRTETPPGSSRAADGLRPRRRSSAARTRRCRSPPQRPRRWSCPTAARARSRRSSCAAARATTRRSCWTAFRSTSQAARSTSAA